MDGDPSVEPSLDSFSLTFPLPYRIASLLVLAVWAWGANLQFLSLRAIDVPSLVRYPKRSSPHEPLHHESSYRLATVLSFIFFASLLLFWLFTHRDPARVQSYDWLALVSLLTILFLLFLPVIFTSKLAPNGRQHALSVLRRVSLGGIAEPRDAKFGDILLADVLTSYAKVLADCFVALCMFLRLDGGSATARPDRHCGGTFIVPIFLALPFVIRLRQCLTEYGRANATVAGSGATHMANAAKYASAFPVVVLAALQQRWPDSAPWLHRLWVMASLVNSLYSFYWDVVKDWDLTLLSPAAHQRRGASDYAFGLRRRLCLGPPGFYYAAVAVDFMLRMTWAVRLVSPRLATEAEGGIFALQALEVGRRWMWIFLRVETEWVRRTEGQRAEDMLLGDFSPYKDDGEVGEDGVDLEDVGVI